MASRPGLIGHKRFFVNRALIVLLHTGLLAGLVGIAEFYLTDPRTPQYTALIDAVNRQGLWLVRSVAPNSDLCREGQGLAGLQPLKANPCLPDRCRLDDYTAWDEWRACKSQQLLTENWVANEARVASALAHTHNIRLPYLSALTPSQCWHGRRPTL